ncbi:uncharacterized protein FFM5_02157 [Fusarium fujikuroi]|nr:uncharacterized protein FFM5_02157 [Fusarium fujikuroi]
MAFNLIAKNYLY